MPEAAATLPVQPDSPGAQAAPPGRAWLATLAVLAVYFALRVPGLWRAPLFNDEAIYGSWTAELLGRPGLATAFAPWGDGKVGFCVWFVGFLDGLAWPGVWGPALLWRWLSVLCGALTLGCVMHMTRRASAALGSGVAAPNSASTRASRATTLAAVWAGLGYACWPWAQIHERMALFDPPLVAFYMIAMLAAARLLRPAPLSMRAAALLGMALALPLTAKLSGAPALVLGLGTAAWRMRRGARERSAFFAVLLGSVVVALPALAPLLAPRSLESVMHRQLASDSGLSLGHSLAIARESLVSLGLSLGPIAPCFMAWGGWVAWRRWRLRGLYWLSWTLAPVGFVYLFGRPGGVFSRYYWPFLTPLWVLFGLAAADLYGSRRALLRRGSVALLCAALAVPAVRSWRWIDDPAAVPLTAGDASQYVSGWPSGWMLDQVQKTLEPMIAAKPPVEVLSMHSWGNPAAGLAYLYRVHHEQLHIREVATTEDAIALLKSPDPQGIRVWLDVGDTAPDPRRTPNFQAQGLILIRRWPATANSPEIAIWKAAP